MKSMWRTLNELFDIMPNGARRFYLIYSILTGMLAGLDTVALALVVVTMSAFASGKPIEIPLIGELPESATIWIVILVCALFILKGVLAILLHWVATRRFAGYELEVGDRIFRAFTKLRGKAAARTRQLKLPALLMDQWQTPTVVFYCHCPKSRATHSRSFLCLRY